jgi:hypothetical protein
VNDFERDYWMGTDVGQLGGYGFQGAIFGVDGSCKDGKLGSECCKFQGKEADKCARVSREEEGTSSSRPELRRVVLAFHSAALSEDVLLLCDNTAVLYTIKKKWVGQGGKATLATAPDADIPKWESPELECMDDKRRQNSPVLGERARTNCLLLLWDGLDEEGLEECERTIQAPKD